VSGWLGWRVEVWWLAEQAAGRWWERAARRERGAGRLQGWACSFTYRRRKRAERRRFRRVHGTRL